MLALAFSMLLCWRAEVWIPGVSSKITLTDVFVCIGILMLGPWAATVLASVDGLSRSVRAGRETHGATPLITWAQ